MSINLKNSNCHKLGMKLLQGIMLSLFLPKLFAFYHVHEMTVLPEIFLQAYQEKHHISNSFQELFNRGSSSYYQMDYKRAEQVYNTLLLINSRDIVALDRLAQVYIRQGRYELALSALQRLLNIEPNYFPAYHLSGLAYLQLKNTKAAIQQAKFLIERGEAFTETYIVLLCSLFLLKQYDNTLAIANVAKEADSQAPQFDFFPILVDFVSSKKGDRLVKEAFFFDNFKDHPDIELYRFIIATLSQDKNAVKSLEKQLEATDFPHPTYPYMFLLSAFELVGQVSNKIKLDDTMRWLAKKLIDTDPEFLPPYRICTEFFLHHHDYKSVIEFAEKGSKNFSEYIPFYEFIGRAAFFEKEFDKAAQALNICLQHRRNDIDLLAFQAIIMLINDDTENAYNNILEMQRKEPAQTNPFANTAFGYFLAKAKRITEAIEPLKEAVKEKRDFYLPYQILIDCLIKNESYREAQNYAQLGMEYVKEEFTYRYGIQIAQRNQEFVRMAGIAIEALKIFPDNKYFAYSLAVAYTQQQEFEKALTAIELIPFSPQEDATHMRLHLNILSKLGRLNDAYEKVRQLLRYKPDQKEYLEFLAAYYIDTKEIDNAITQYEKISRTGLNMDYEIAWMRCLADSALCSSQLESVVSQYPENTDQRALSLYRLGLILATNRSTQSRSTTVYEDASAMRPMMEDAKQSHQQYLSFFPQYRQIIEKNLQIYFQKNR